MLSKIRKSISRYADPLVSPEEALENHIDVVSFDPWASDDNFFKCLQDAEFDTLLCDRSDPPSDEEILLPDLSQRLLTEQADAIDNMFNDYRCLKGSEDGDGFSWPGTRWRQRYPNRYERRANINTKHYEIPAHSQPYDTLRTIYHVRSQPHMIYHTMHLDEKTESLLRSEVIFLVDVIKGRMWDQRQFMFTTFPVLMLSIHGSNARLMIAYVDEATQRLTIKLSRREDFSASTDVDHRRAMRRCFTKWLFSECEGAKIDENAESKKILKTSYV